MKPIMVYCPVFRRTVWTFFAWKQDDFFNYIKKSFSIEMENLSEINGCVRIFRQDKSGHEIIILWVRKSNKLEELSCLCHESIHASNIIIRESGHDLCAKNDELQAYHASMIFRGAISKK
jgi:hypothetical protein